MFDNYIVSAKYIIQQAKISGNTQPINILINGTEEYPEFVLSILYQVPWCMEQYNLLRAVNEAMTKMEIKKGLTVEQLDDIITYYFVGSHAYAHSKTEDFSVQQVMQVNKYAQRIVRAKEIQSLILEFDKVNYDKVRGMYYHYIDLITNGENEEDELHLSPVYYKQPYGQIVYPGIIMATVQEKSGNDFGIVYTFNITQDIKQQLVIYTAYNIILDNGGSIKKGVDRDTIHGLICMVLPQFISNLGLIKAFDFSSNLFMWFNTQITPSIEGIDNIIKQIADRAEELSIMMLLNK